MKKYLPFLVLKFRISLLFQLPRDTRATEQGGIISPGF